MFSLPDLRKIFKRSRQLSEEHIPTAPQTPRANIGRREGTSQDVSFYFSAPSPSSSQPSTTVKMSRFLSTGVYR